MKQRYLLLIILTVFLVGLSGVYNVQATEKLAKEQILHIAFDAGDAKTLDPHRAATTVDRSTVDPIFSGLVRYPPGNQVNVEPDLATSWEVSKDGKVWTFHLRKGVFFHPFPGYPDGYELTSEDIVYSLKHAANPDHSSYAGEYAGIAFKAVDAYTVEINIENPISETLFLAKFANYAGGFIVCKKAIEAKGNDWIKTNPVGTGPFMFKAYDPRQKTVLVQNKNYFRGSPILKQVEIRYMPSVSSRELGFRTGELEIIEGLNEDKWVNKIATFPDVKVKTFGPCEVQMLHFNMTKAPFNDIKVRKAFCYAVSRKDVAAFMGESLAVPIYSSAMASPASGALTKAEAIKEGVIYEDDVVKAKKLLAEAGHPNGFKTEVIISELATSYRKPMVAIQAQVKKAGIDMKLKVVDHSSFHSLIRDDASPAVYYACWRPNVDVFLTRFFHSDSTVVTGKKPDTGFSHYGTVDADGDGKIDSIDDLIKAARLELDSTKQIALWKQAQIKLLKNAAVLPIIRLKYAFPMKSYVELGHPLEFSWQTYSPQINEKTKILAH
ncbi:MAG: ABC transporter substrate-binding protein [Thermodesulfobacteriota bacterium]|nr:ABC transporter substrate-binding protein [Thermodesulfobacteriota bacterium]